MISAIDLICKERVRQIAAGWSADHDDQHAHAELAIAAADLLLHTTDEHRTTSAHDSDAWGLVAKHGDNRIKSLVIAGALVAAELDRELRILATELVTEALAESEESE